MARNSSNRGILLTAIDAMMAVRQRQADRYVSSVLLSLDDKTLAASGYSRADLLRRSSGLS